MPALNFSLAVFLGALRAQAGSEFHSSWSILNRTISNRILRSKRLARPNACPDQCCAQLNKRSGYCRRLDRPCIPNILILQLQAANLLRFFSHREPRGVRLQGAARPPTWK